MPDNRDLIPQDAEKSNSPVPPGVLALSPSKIETLQCPYRFRKLYVIGEKLRGAEAVELALGTLAHNIAQNYVRHLRDTKRATDPLTLQAMAAIAWNERPHTVPLSCKDSFDEFMAVLGDIVLEPSTVVDSEMRLAFSDDWQPVLWDDDAARWGGMLDLFGIRGRGGNASAYAIDWTTAAISGQFAAKKDMQLRFYGLLIYKGYGIDRVHITTKSLRTGASRSVDLDVVDHVETEKRIRGEAERRDRLLAADPAFEWPAIPNSQCGICSYKCPAYDASLLTDVPIRVNTQEEAAELLNSLTVLDSRRKAVVETLKGYVSFHGPVESNGMEAAMRTRLTVTYPMEKVYEVLKSEVDDPFAALKLNSAKFRAKKYDPIRDEIASLGETKTSDRFGVKAAKLDDPTFDTEE